VDMRLKEHQQHIRLEHPDKSAVAWDTAFIFTIPPSSPVRLNTWIALLGRPLRLSSIPTI
jgi:hypothetical protein